MRGVRAARLCLATVNRFSTAATVSWVAIAALLLSTTVSLIAAVAFLLLRTVRQQTKSQPSEYHQYGRQREQLVVHICRAHRPSVSSLNLPHVEQISAASLPQPARCQVGTNALDRFRIRECYRPYLLSHPGLEL
jgi:hypothetical protein